MNNKKKPLLDRDKEVLQLSSMINNSKNNNLVILVSGISGIGKSGLIRKLKDSGVISSMIVTVKMSKNSISTIENLQYFNAIYKSLQDFSFRNNELIPTPTQHGFSSIGNLIRYIFSLFKSKKGFGDAISISESAEDISIIRKKDYINYILKTSNIILDIENIQNIDTQSFEILREIIEYADNKVFILEYTIDEKDKTHFSNLYKELLETDADIVDYKVKEMDFFYAKQLAPINKQIDVDVLKHRYEIGNGNLMEIILSSENSNFNESNINTSLRSLSETEKYIVFLINLNDNSITHETLYRLSVLQSTEQLDCFVRNCDEDEVIRAINKLKSRRILDETDSTLFLVHDSIIRELNKVKKEPILYYAYSNIKELYLNKLSSNKYDSETIEKLLSLFIRFSDPELLKILPNIKHFLLELKYPKLIIKELEKYRQKLSIYTADNEKILYSLSIMLVEICLTNKLFEEAQKNLDIIFDESNPYHIALQGEIYALQESRESGILIINLFSKTNSNTRLDLILKLCVLYHSMKIEKTKHSKAYGKRILKTREYKKYKEYGYALRNYAELCESNNECLNYYKKALEFFKKHNMTFEVASIYISLSMIYSYVGRLKTAKNCIDKAIKIGGNSISKCYILNNLSAIEILSRTYNNKTEKNLIDSALLSATQYERIIIYCNLLVYYCLTQNYESAKKYAIKIEKSNYRTFKYEEFRHIVFQNLLFYYSAINNIEMKEYYHNKILSLINDSNTRRSTKHLAKEMNGLAPVSSFYSQFPFRIDFLGYWEFSIDNDLDHFL